MKFSAGFLASLAFLCSAAHSAQGEPSADLVLRGGAVYTLDPARPWASAIAIANGKIVYVGDDSGAQVFVGAATRIAELEGRMVLPGLHDAHAHPMTGGMRLLRCNFSEFRTAEAIYDAVRECGAADHGAWLIASDLHLEAFSGGGPGVAKLDALVPDRPAFVMADDGLSGWVNSWALEISGFSAADAPSGIARGDVAGAIWSRQPRPSEAEYREAFRRWSALANSFGITSVFDASASEAVLDAYRASDQAGELTLRVVAAQRVDTKSGPEQVDDLVARRERVRGRRFRADAAKIFLDGEISAHAAAMLEPYADAPETRGELSIAPEALDTLVRRLDEAGFDIMMHAMGDRAVRAALDAIEKAMAANGPRDRRLQIAHVGVANPADIPRFGKLGVSANFQPAWFHAGDPVAASSERALGAERSRFIHPMASIAAAGGIVTASSDWPSPPLNPFEIMQVAVTRQPLDGGKPARQKDERVTLALAIAAYTKNAAWAAREETLDGSIVAGKAADLVVLDRNLFETDPGEIHKTRVLLTLLDGEAVFGDPDFLPR